eukprot:403342960
MGGLCGSTLKCNRNGEFPEVDSFSNKISSHYGSSENNRTLKRQISLTKISREDVLIQGVESQLKMLENKLNICRDKIAEFQKLTLSPDIKKAKKNINNKKQTIILKNNECKLNSQIDDAKLQRESNVIQNGETTFYVVNNREQQIIEERLLFLTLLENDQALYSYLETQLDLVHQKINQMTVITQDSEQIRADNLNFSNWQIKANLTNKTLKLALENCQDDLENKIVNQAIGQFQSMINQLKYQHNLCDKQFKQIFVEFVTYKDSADMTYEFESAFSQLSKENEEYSQNIEKHREFHFTLGNFLENHISQNLNYGNSFIQKYLKDYDELQSDVVVATASLQKIQNSFNIVVEQREKLIQDKFQDVEELKNQHEIMMNLVKARDKFKNKIFKVQNALKETRRDMRDVGIRELQYTLQERVDSLRDQIESLIMRGKSNQQVQLNQYFTTLMKFKGILLKINEDLSIVFKNIELIANLESINFKELTPIIDAQNKINQEIMTIESNFMKQEMERYHEQVLDRILTFENQSDFQEVKVIQCVLDDLLSQLDEIKMPNHFKAEDSIDRMLLDFQKSKNSDIMIKKLSSNNYLFGSRKIQTKVNNGILLVRVGGGLMTINNFYEQYSQMEIIKQRKEEEKTLVVQQKHSEQQSVPTSQKKTITKLQPRKISTSKHLNSVESILSKESSTAKFQNQVILSPTNISTELQSFIDPTSYSPSKNSQYQKYLQSGIQSSKPNSRLSNGFKKMPTAKINLTGMYFSQDHRIGQSQQNTYTQELTQNLQQGEDISFNLDDLSPNNQSQNIMRIQNKLKTVSQSTTNKQQQTFNFRSKRSSQNSKINSILSPVLKQKTKNSNSSLFI